MFAERDSQKDSQQNLKDSLKDINNMPAVYRYSGLLSESYPKLNKLITALYIVTDIMDSGEPLRLNLRTLGAEVLSDTNSLSKTKLAGKIQTILSFLDIASAINLISEMNFNILKKEFFEFSRSVEEFKEVSPVWLEEFLAQSPLLSPHPNPLLAKERENSNSKSNSIGVQKGSTLLKALSGVEVSDRNNALSDNNFLKKQRRDDIIKAIKDNTGSATITDIRARATGALATCGEKTLQRELVSMVKDGVLKKTGEKRWSKYYI